MKRTIVVALLLAACSFAVAAPVETKSRLIGLLDAYTDSDGRVVMAVVASPAEVVSQAAIEIQFAPSKLQLIDARGRNGVQAQVMEQEGRTVVQFWPGVEARQAGLQVLGYLEFQNLKGREYAEVLMPMGWVNGVETAPGAARVQTERRAQLQFLAEGMVAVPVTRASRVTFDDRQLEFVKSVPEGLYPEQNRSVRGKRAGPQIRLTGSQDEVTVLFFQRLESDPRRLNDPILVSIVE